MSFGALLSERVGARGSQVVLGLDPDPQRLWPVAAGAADPATAVATHSFALIDAAGPACVAVKPQLACFERLGAPGWAALERVVEYARAAGLLVIADGKRGDVPVTARAYAEALFGPPPALAADAATANPLLGVDALRPLLDAGRGVFVLVRTSNAGAADVQDLELAGGGALWERLARLVDALGSDADAGGRGGGGGGGGDGGGGDGGGLADVGAVVGATAPEHLERMRELMPRAPFLLPGIGAQGGEVQALAPAFAPGPAGGLVSASRSIADAHERDGRAPAAAARAEAERLRELAWSLA